MAPIIVHKKRRSAATKNPVKYNGVPNHEGKKHPFALVIDWLSIHFYLRDLSIFNGFGDDKLIIGDVCLLLQDFQTRHFKTVYRVSVAGQDLGVLSLNPSSTVSYNEKSCSLKVTNCCFYANTWYELVERLKSSLGLEFRNITRLDIALDTTCTNLLNLTDSYFHSQDKGEQQDIKYLGRSSIQMFATNIKGNVYKNFKFGVPRSKNSKINRTFTIYNKTHELEISEKEYIANFHKLNGLVGSDVYRHELRLQSQFIRKINRSFVDMETAELSEAEPIKLEDINAPEFLNSLYKYSLSKFVEFTTHSGCKNVTNRLRYNLFSFELLPCDQLYFERVKPSNSAPTQTAKCTVGFLVNEYFTSPVNDNGDYEISSIVGSIVDIVSRYDLSDWFNKKFVSWQFKIDCHVDFYKYYKGDCYKVFKSFYNNFAKDKKNVYAL